MDPPVVIAVKVPIRIKFGENESFCDYKSIKVLEHILFSKSINISFPQSWQD